jgi:hypothetical protein
MTLQTFLKELITEQPLRCGISQITDRELFYGNIMIGGDMDILNRFLKTNSSFPAESPFRDSAAPASG